MSVQTYQQILAQQYEESARDLLVHEEFENTEGVDPHNSSNQVGTTLENPEDFQQFAGDRGTAEHIIVPKQFVDNGTNSVRYRKDVQNDIFIIDTRFRSYAVAGIPALPQSLVTNPNYVSPILSNATSITSDFVFHIQRLVRNVMSATLTSFELPNTFFNIVDIRNNYFIYIRAGYDENVPFALIRLTITYRGTAELVVDNDAGLIPGMSIVFAESLGIILADTTYYIISSGSKTITISLTLGGPAINPDGTIGMQVQSIASYYTQVPVFITDINISSNPVAGQRLGPAGQNGFYYSNTSIIPALNTALQAVGITDITVSYSNGYCLFNNNSTIAYTLNFTPVSSSTNPQIFATLGNMLGFNSFVYRLNPINTTPPPISPCDFQCGQISACQCYGILTGEDPINMNADPYIYISIADWDNIRHQSINDSYFTAFSRIPINIPKGQLIYDNMTNNTMTKKYYFLQPTNLQQFEIKLLDINGLILLMPNTNWTMALEMEEVLSQSLYEKLREL